MNPRHSGTLRKKLLTAGVSSTILATVASCQTSLAPGTASIGSIPREPLLFPGVTVDVVPAQLPEAGFIALRELQRVDPLRGLPEIEMRDEQPGGAAMIWGNWLPLVARRHHALLAGEILEGHVGGVTVEGVGQRVAGRRAEAGVGQDRLDRNACPVRIELAPLGHAVDIAMHLRLRQRVECLPRPRLDRPWADLQRELPVFRIDLRRRPGGEHRKPIFLVLARRQPHGLVRAGTTSEKTTRRQHRITPSWDPEAKNITAPA